MNIRRLAILTAFVPLAVVGVLGIVGELDGMVLGALLVLGAVLGVAFGWQTGISTEKKQRPLTRAEREAEARRLRAARERERAFYEMTGTLSGTLESGRILDAVQNIGKLVTQNGQGTLVSAALLFQGGKNQLQVASSRGLSPSDQNNQFPGKEGVLGLALKGSEPVFGGLARLDPELQYIGAFQNCQSVLAVPLRAGFDYYGVLVFGSTEENAFAEDYVELLKAIGTQATIGLQNAVLYHSILEEKERIVEVDEDARKKLARDLHDGPTQSIAAIAMRINFIRRLIEGQNKQAFAELGKVEDIARKTTKEIRHMLFTLRPLILETQGLVAALEQLSEKMRDTHNQNVVIQAPEGIEKWLDSNAQGVVFYIIEEAVNNARKHAQAAHIWVRLNKQDDFFVVEIEDDGVGFNLSAVEGSYETRGSLGMVNMRERAELVEGTLHMASEEGTGTKISVIIPIDETVFQSRQNVAGRPVPTTEPSALKQAQDGNLPKQAPFLPGTTPFVESNAQPPRPSTPKPPKPAIPHADKRSPGV